MYFRSPENIGGRLETLIEQQAAIVRGQFGVEECMQVADRIATRLSRFEAHTMRLQSQSAGVHSTEMELHKLDSRWADIDRLVRRAIAFAHDVVELPEDWGNRRKYWPVARGHVMEPGSQIGLHNARKGSQGVAMLVGLASTVEIAIVPVTNELIDPIAADQMTSTQLNAGDVLFLDVEQRPLYQECNNGDTPSTHMIVFERPTVA